MARKGTGSKWQVVERPQGEAFKWGNKPGKTLIGTLMAHREVTANNEKTDVFEIKNEDGLWAVFARGELLDKLALVWDFPGRGTPVKIEFTEYAPTKYGKGKERRCFEVSFQSPDND